MSTTLANCRILLSKALGDYWASTTTTTATPATTELVDTALKAKADDWITDVSFDLITETGSNEHEERKILKLDNDSGLLTVLAHSATIDASVDYEIHRLFTASEKRLALIHAAKAGFPHIHKQIWDESKAVDDDDLHKEIAISTLGLAQNRPHQVWQCSDKSDDSLTWFPLRNYTIDNDGNLWLLEGTCGYDLRIIGIGYLNFADDDGVVGTDWDDDSIDIDSPQTEILVAEAAIYLCHQKVIPNDTSGTNILWAQALADWKRELRERISRLGMKAPSPTVHWGV